MSSATQRQQPLSQPALGRVGIAKRLHSGLAVSVSQRWRMWYRRWATRCQLLALGPAELADIGLTRSQQYQEARKPFWVK